ncbi:MAG: hypothetical protein ACKO5C_02985 [Ferruginibacter sp.]
MKRSVITSIIFKTHRPTQLLAAMLGCLVGFLLVVVSVQTYLNFQQLLNDKTQTIGSQYLVLNKSVSISNTLDMSKSAFSSKQIEDVRTHPSVVRVSTFTPNQFEAIAFLELKTGDGSVASLKTDLFMESVEDGFIDVQTKDWGWMPSTATVPVILPTDFINLYNFTYAPARGLPQISRATAELFSFKIILSDASGPVTYTGKIAGFSNRITSMIVPSSFMQYANTRFTAPQGSGSAVYRLIAEVRPKQMASFQDFLKEKGYETNEELLRSAKFSGLLQAILSIVFLLGAVMIVNAFVGFILYLQLTIARSKYELETLLRLGYRHRSLTRWYANGIGSILILVGGTAFAALIYIQQEMQQFLDTMGFSVSSSIDGISWLTGTGLMVVLYGLFLISVRRQIYGLALPR